MYYVDVEEGEQESEEGHSVEINIILKQEEGRNTQRDGDAGSLYEQDIWTKRGGFGDLKSLGTLILTCHRSSKVGP